MTYKALRRIEDKQWMKITQGTSVWVTPCSHPTDNLINDLVKLKNIAYTDINWSLYEVVEVIPVCVDDLPSDEEVITEVDKVVNDISPTSKWFTKDKMSEIGLRCASFMKSQILK